MKKKNSFGCAMDSGIFSEDRVFRGGRNWGGKNSGTFFREKIENKWSYRCVEISHVMSKSRDWDELQYTWLEWRRRSGSKNVKELYQQLVQLINEAAQLNSTCVWAIKSNGKYELIF